MLTTKIMASVTERDGLGAETHLRLIDGPDGWALEIEHANIRHALMLRRRELNEIAEAIHVLRPARGKTRPVSRRLGFQDGTLAIDHDNRGEPYREGLVFSLPAAKDDGRNPHVFLATRDLDDFHADLVKVLKTD